jgi:hypothetical protein
VTTPPVGLRAHERRRRLGGELLEPGQAGGERFAVHVIRIGPEPLHPPAVVGRAGPDPPPAAELGAEADVGDPRLGQHRRHGLGVEMGLAPGGRVTANVRQASNGVGAEQAQESLGLVRRVAHGEDLAGRGGRLWHGEIVRPEAPIRRDLRDTRSLLLPTLPACPS